MKRLFNRVGEPDLDQLEIERRWRELDALCTKDNLAEFKKCEKEFADENRNNKPFVNAMKHRASAGDPLVIWMLKYLISRAESGR